MASSSKEPEVLHAIRNAVLVLRSRGHKEINVPDNLANLSYLERQRLYFRLFALIMSSKSTSTPPQPTWRI